MSGLVSLIRGRAFDVLLVLMALGTIVLGSFGWADHYDATLDAEGGAAGADWFAPIWWKISYVGGQVVRAFLLADNYANPWDHGFDWRITTAGWLGTFVAGGALIKGVISLFVKPLARQAARQRKGHAVVLGERDIAHRTCVSLRDAGWVVTYHGDIDQTDLEGILVVPRPVDPEDAFFKASVKGANRVVIAEASDAETAEMAVRMAEFAPKALVFALFENPTLAAALRQSNVAGLDDDGIEDHLIALSETRALARTTLIPAPPFLLADAQNQSRIHMLIYGFTPLALSLIEETLYMNAVPGQKSPRFTVLTKNAYAARQMFDARHPNLSDETSRSDYGRVDIEFIECPFTAITTEAIATIAPIIGKDEITAAYVAVEDDDEPVAAAIALQTAARQHNLFAAPIFVQSRDGNGMRVTPLAETLPLGLYTFGRWDDLIKALGILDHEPDKLARSYHENYCESVLNSHGAEQAWEVLPEAFRMANRNAVLHLPAKLFAAGFDILPYLSSEDALSPNTAPGIQPGVDIVTSDEMRHTLAVLEHERWMMERWVSGWRHGARDNARYKHPNLVAFEELDETTKNLDMIFVDGLGKWVRKDAKTGLHRN